jgi:integrase
VKVKPTVAESTHDRYSMIVRLQLKPHLGHVQLTRLRPAHVEQMLAKLHEAGEPIPTQRMSAIVLGTACRWAASPKKRLITLNPTFGVERPRVDRKPMRIWNAEQCRVFLATTSTHRLYALFVLALTTGMRQGEIFGLHWSDMDFANGILFVNKQLRELRGNVFLGGLKTGASQRAIALPRIAFDGLHEHRKHQLTEGHDVKDGPLFLSAEGAVLRKSNFLRYDYLPLVRKSGLPRIRFHDSRHSAASLLMALGENPKVVQERLGHSRIETTMNIYAHVNHGMQKAAADRPDEVFG